MPVTFAEHGVCAEPLYVTLAGQLTTVVEPAGAMTNVLESLLALWLVSPAKLALAVAVPALTLLVCVTVSDCERPPTPVTVAVHGVCAAPV